MKGSEFLDTLVKQLPLSSAEPWWFQGSREMAGNATPAESENRSTRSITKCNRLMYSKNLKAWGFQPFTKCLCEISGLSGGYSLKEIGDPFGLRYSRVSRIVKQQVEAGAKRKA
ncbi:MAG: hypothetical protein V7629_06425 [Motiliproteus sp.]